MDVTTKIIYTNGEKGKDGGPVWGEITGEIEDQTDLNDALNSKADIADLADVCFSNDYDDLNNKPNLANVALSSNYNDLTNKPTIPQKTSDLVNDAGFLTSTDGLLDVIFPVGCFYWSSNSTNPNNIFGGTWTQVKDKFIVSAGDDFSQGETGGEKFVDLDFRYLPIHRHSLKDENFDPTFHTLETDNLYSAWDYVAYLKDIMTADAGGYSPHNNMPPYEVAYCFYRVA